MSKNEKDKLLEGMEPSRRSLIKGLAAFGTAATVAAALPAASHAAQPDGVPRGGRKKKAAGKKRAKKK